MKTKMIALLGVILINRPVYSQEEFFQSKQRFTEDQLQKFYSSVTLHGNQILFAANDYNLYSYDRKTGEQQWVSHLSYKTRRECYTADGYIYAPYYKDGYERTAILDSATGKLVRLLPTGMLETKPHLRGGILYGTAIIDGGMLFAYHVKKDSILWTRFLAHGVSTQPYFFDEYIYANAEAHNWVRVNYKGELMDTACKESAEIFVKDIPCKDVFNALAHDMHRINADLSERIFTDRETISPGNTTWSANKSFVLADDKLLIIGKNGKRLKVEELVRFLPATAFGISGSANRILFADKETISFLFQEQLMIYDHGSYKLLRTIDLSGWEPAQATLDAGKVWLVSKKDGLLYGLIF